MPLNVLVCSIYSVMYPQWQSTIYSSLFIDMALQAKISQLAEHMLAFTIR